jgi:hypothetical protein
MITVEDINALAAEKTRIRAGLAQIGRDIYAIREGNALESGFRLSSYMLNTFDGTHYAGMDEEDWEIGTPLISLSFYNPGWQQSREITFPQAWLTADYKQLETDRVTAIKEAERLKAEEAAREAAVAREASDRRTYDRLKEKFG